MSIPSYAVTVAGHPGCPCQAVWIPAFEHEANRRGILSGALPLSQLIGGDPRSGGTHVDGGADDSYPLTTIKDVPGYVWLSRQMGADATWLRPFDWDGRNGVEHVHRVLTGCPHNGPARYQIDAVRAGLNGLANHGPDTGPRPLSGRTWRQGIKWAKQEEEDAMFGPEQQEQLNRIEKRLGQIGDRSAARDKALRLMLKQRFKVTDTQLDEIFDAVKD